MKQIWILLLVLLIFGCSRVVTTPTTNESDNKTTENKTIVLNDTVPTVIPNETLVPANVTSNITQNETNLTVTNETPVPPEEIYEDVVEARYKNEPPKDEEIAAEPITEVLPVDIDTYDDYLYWYKCRGACKFDCAYKDQNYLYEDMYDEGAYCTCTCEDGDEFYVKDHNKMTIDVLEQTDESVTVAYKDTR